MPTITEPPSLTADIAEIRGLMSRLESKIDEYISRLIVLEDKPDDHPDLHQTPDPSLFSLPDTVHQLSTRLTHCELNHESVLQSFTTIRKIFIIFLVWGLLST